ncbi:MAG TPA: M48 family metalloprotease [Dermatophilaceae bacterium]|nr:M48 family metalloprotease [Dermatophilaceae bacterium]
MTAVMAAPVLVSVVLGLSARRLGRWLPPATAVRVLSLSSLVTALSTGFVLSVAAFLAVAQLSPVASVGRWSASALRAAEPVPLLLGALSGAAAALLIGAAVRRAALAARDLFTAAATCRRLGAGSGGLVVVEDDLPEAYALPGLGGRVVVSTAMLRALTGPERRAMLAHEAAHLRHHHHLFVQATALAAAADPLLRPCADVVRAGVERWADEEAARVTGDRFLAARAVARASLAQHQARARMPAPRAALGMADSVAVARARALLGPAPPPRRALAASVASLMLVGAAAAVTTAHDTEQLFERAHSAFTATG